MTLWELSLSWGNMAITVTFRERDQGWANPSLSHGSFTWLGQHGVGFSFKHLCLYITGEGQKYYFWMSGVILHIMNSFLRALFSIHWLAPARDPIPITETGPLKIITLWVLCLGSGIHLTWSISLVWLVMNHLIITVLYTLTEEAWYKLYIQ